MKNLIAKILFRLYFGKSINEIDELDFIDNYLKKRGYDEYGNIYTKGFVVIEIKSKAKKITAIEIFTDQVSKTKQTISNNFSTGLIIAENYFKRYV